jgi:hypothetical protein
MINRTKLRELITLRAVPLLEQPLVHATAELVTLEVQSFFRNRDIFISELFFENNGDVFVTVIGEKFVLSWDRTLRPSMWKAIDGRLKSHGKFLTMKTKDELELYKRVNP